MPTITDTEIRSYLLGITTDTLREEIEETLLIGDEGLERLEMAEEDLIEAFLDNELDAEQSARFQNHFLCTTARKEKLAYLQAIRQVAVRQSQPEPLPSNVVSFAAPQRRKSFYVGMNRSSYLKLAAAILIVGSVGFLVWRYAFRPSPSAAVVALNRAYANGRTLETRIGSLDFAPYAPTRGAGDADANARILRERAERIVLDAYAEAPTAANRHALGKYYLADKQFDKAIEQFNAIIKDTPNLAEVHNDLGAALLEKSKYEKRNNQPGDSLQHRAASLESIEQALKLQPNYPAAIFNRALCLQEMYLPRQAIEEWKKYLQLDSNSKWAEEARRRLEELEKAPSKISKSDDELYQDYLKEPENDERTFDLFCHAYSTTGNGITERLIDSYLAAKQSNNETEATNKLQLLEKLGALIYQRTTDPYVRDVGQFYRQALVSRQPLLLKARYHLNEGRNLRSSSQRAAASYETAISLFREALDECEAKMTMCLLGRLHLRQSNLHKSRKLFEDLAAPENGYLWLRGESLNGMAEYYQRQYQSDQSIRAHKLVLALAKQLGNTGLTLISLGNLAKQYSNVGNWEETLYYQQQALATFAKKNISPKLAWDFNEKAAINMFASGFQSAAIAYQQEALRIEQEIGRPLQLSRTYTHLGAILGKDAQFAKAISFLKEAVNIGTQVENERTGLDIQEYSGLYLANVQRQAGELTAALQSYERIRDINQQLNNPADDFEIYRGKAITEIALGHTLQARRDLAQALSLFERNFGQIFAEKERTTFFDKEYDIFDAAIGFSYADNAQTAFNISEKGRARSLMELLKGRRSINANQPTPAASIRASSPSLDSQSVQQKLANGTSLLEFACLPDRLIVWGISASEFTHHQQAIPLHSLEQKVQALLQSLTEKAPAADNQTTALSAELYRILIEPLEPFLAKAETVCIVPDKALHYLPFAALFSTRQQKYLIESHAIIIAPSASVFLLCTERARRQSASHKERVLAVGNPRFDQAQYAQLADLKAAEREVDNVARNYARSRVLTAESASEKAVKAELKAASILHLAAHGMVDQRSPPNSRLLLAKPVVNDGEDGALRAYEIAQLHLHHIRLAVLSSCQSGVGRFYRGEGISGLTHAFLTAGVPSVVASLWAVDSDVTATLMTYFHQQLKLHSLPQAMRDAQLALLYQTNSKYRHPYYWAAFSTFGGNMALK